MKQRILSAIAGLVVLAVVLSFFDSFVLNAAISVICLLAVYEVLSATKHLNNGVLTAIGFAFAALIPFSNVAFIRHILPVICYILILALYLVLLKNHNSMDAQQVGFMFFICLTIPFSLTTAIYMRDSLGMALGLFYTLFALCASWMADTGAYFSGMFFGKRKLAPEISPKKTIEGAIGGFVIALVSCLLFGWAYAAFCARALSIRIEINYLLIALVSPLLTAVSIVGDLSASVLKRQSHVKDFGSIMPGHGGVMDRFDSVLFVLPLVYILSRFAPLARLL